VETRLFVFALGVAIGIALLGWLRRDLVGRGAHRLAFLLAAVAYVAAGAAWLAVALTPLPATVAWVASIPAALVTAVPGLLVRVTGGSTSLARLRAEIAHLRSALAVSPGPAAPDAQLRQRTHGLDRWRTPATTELIDLVQERAFDRLDGLPVDPAREAARDARIEELLEGLPAGPRLSPRAPRARRRRG
jgi:hypothetical protein